MTSSLPASSLEQSAAGRGTGGTERIPSLDGLRAVSIVAVLLGHLAGTAGFPTKLSRIIANPYVDVANLGVRVFFVISGYLITWLLLAEAARYGKISLAYFYFRRTLRIFPASLLFLAAVTALSAAGTIELHRYDLLHAFTYTVNYARDRSWYVGHLWSLSLEEQFYLLWPVLVVTLGFAGAFRSAAAFVLAVPVIRVTVWFLVPSWRAVVGNSFGTAGDAIAIGCLLAGWRPLLDAWAPFRAAMRTRWVIPVVLLVGLVLSTRALPSMLLGTTLTNVVIALVVARMVESPGGVVGRLLNAPAVTALGRMSYSAYLWQQLFLNRGGHGAGLTAFPVNCLGAGVLAVLSYRGVELPMLAVRGQLERAWLAPRTPVRRSPAVDGVASAPIGAP